jgi:hypothetical protein
MKTTVEVPDKLYRQIKSRAAAKGQTIKAFFLDALQDKLAKEQAANGKQSGWRAVFGKAKKEDMAELQRVIDEEFSKIDPEGW